MEPKETRRPTAEFKHGAALTAVIKDILAEDGVRAAVAFWGRGCEDWVTGGDAKIIANLRMGGTNPHALKKVKASIKRCERLHAKVFIGRDRAVVASANVSINGLALEGAETASWIEAGIVTDDVASIGGWFDDLWLRGSHDITGPDWERAEAAWSLRPRAKPSLESFADFDVDADTLPLVTWIDDSTWTVNEHEVRKQLGHFDALAKQRVDAGIGISDPVDESVLKERWVLCWMKGARARTMKDVPWFAETSATIVRNGFSYDHDGKPSDVMLAPESDSAQPFDPGEKRFVAALRETLRNSAFQRLHEDEKEGEGWFAARQPLLRQFWAQLKQVYDRTGAEKG
ncbi:MAG: phospholipase D family protein [Janthinobacterium lividum]